MTTWQLIKVTVSGGTMAAITAHHYLADLARTMGHPLWGTTPTYTYSFRMDWISVMIMTYATITLMVITLITALTRDYQATRADRHGEPTHTDAQGYLTRGA
jgi:hypothetical protein